MGVCIYLHVNSGASGGVQEPSNMCRALQVGGWNVGGAEQAPTPEVSKLRPTQEAQHPPSRKVQQPPEEEFRDLQGGSVQVVRRRSQARDQHHRKCPTSAGQEAQHPSRKVQEPPGGRGGGCRNQQVHAET